jgi:electron transport complex protein RnfB
VTALTAIGTIGGLTTALVTLLVLANRKLHVDEDPRIDAVEEMLPHANCGACGYPGCRPFAEALVSGAAQPGKCTVSSDDGLAVVADFLGVVVGERS